MSTCGAAAGAAATALIGPTALVKRETVLADFSGSPRTAYAFAGAGVLVLVFAGFLMRSRIEISDARSQPRVSGDMPLPTPLTTAPVFEATATPANGGDPPRAATRQNV